MIVFLTGIHSVDVAVSRSRIDGSFAHLEIARDTVSDDSEVGVDGTVYTPGENYSRSVGFGGWVRSDLDPVEFESGVKL